MKPEAYPILVAHYEGTQASTLVCPECCVSRLATTDEMTMCHPFVECESCHGAELEWMYHEADCNCKNCGKLGDDFPHDDYCSRRCELQGEYAASLRAVQP